MTEPEKPYIGLTCDCGHDFNVSVRGIELDDLITVCPACGSEEKLTSEQISDIVARTRR